MSLSAAPAAAIITSCLRGGEWKRGGRRSGVMVICRGIPSCLQLLCGKEDEER